MRFGFVCLFYWAQPVVVLRGRVDSSSDSSSSSDSVSVSVSLSSFPFDDRALTGCIWVTDVWPWTFVETPLNTNSRPLINNNNVSITCIVMEWLCSGFELIGSEFRMKYSMQICFDLKCRPKLKRNSATVVEAVLAVGVMCSEVVKQVLVLVHFCCCWIRDWSSVVVAK